MSLGNLWVNLQGIADLRRRVRPENKLRRWLEIAGWAQVNTWIWSSVFHSRGEALSIQSMILRLTHRYTFDGAIRLFLRYCHRLLFPHLRSPPSFAPSNTLVDFPTRLSRHCHRGLSRPLTLYLPPLISIGSISLWLPYEIRRRPRDGTQPPLDRLVFIVCPALSEPYHWITHNRLSTTLPA